MVSPKVIKAAEALVIRYRTITEKEIMFSDGHFADGVGNLNSYPFHLTGFGDTAFCTLCKATRNNTVGYKVVCNECIYQGYLNCNSDGNKKSFDAIVNSRNPEELLVAFKARASHIETILRRLK